MYICIYTYIHYITLHYIPLHYITLHYITLHCINTYMHKSAHTGLAMKACLLGGNIYTKCSITLVNIAVAISALAGGERGPKTISPRDRNFCTKSRSWWCFRFSSTIFGRLSFRGYGNEILGRFALPFLLPTANLSSRFPVFETSATALWGF